MVNILLTKFKMFLVRFIDAGAMPVNGVLVRYKMGYWYECGSGRDKLLNSKNSFNVFCANYCINKKK